METNVLEKLEILESKMDYLVNKMGHQQEVFSAREAAEYLRISSDYLRRTVIPSGKLRYKLKGKEYLFRREWLDDWMER